LNNLNVAVYNGHITCAKKLGKNSEEFIKIWYDCCCGDWINYRKDATWYAAANGHVECLKYCTENGYNKHPMSTYEASRNGHLECLKYCTENKYH
jgi:hypothetical protein